MAGPRGRRAAALALRLLLVLFVTALLAEVAVRAVLFHGAFTGWKSVRALRRPDHFASPQEDVWWQLRRYLGQDPDGKPREARHFDPLLGWLRRGVEPRVYDHVARSTLGGRRPVLLYGDSFAACVTPAEECFEGLLRGSEYGGRYAIVNYGSGGYGLDQIYLLLRESIDRWVDDGPVVLVSLLVDDDMDRALLSLRDWCKPRLEVQGGVLVPEREPLWSTAEYMEREFPPACSWAWRLLLHSGALPARVSARLDGSAGRERRARELATLLLEDAIEVLRRRGLPFGFVLFHKGVSVARPRRLDWRERTVTEVLEREGVPFVLSREGVARDAELTGRPIRHYFITEGPAHNHLNELGNQVVFRDLLRLLLDLAGERR